MSRRSLAFARAAKRFFDRHPRLGPILFPYYRLAALSLSCLLRASFRREVHCAVLRHRCWNFGSSDIDPLLFLEPMEMQDEIRFLTRFWRSYDRLRIFFPLLASHWELRLVRMEDLKNHPAQDLKRSGFLHLQPWDWVPIFRPDRVQGVRRWMIEHEQKGVEFEPPFSHVADFRLNDALQKTLLGARNRAGGNGFALELNAMESRTVAQGSLKLERFLRSWELHRPPESSVEPAPSRETGPPILPEDRILRLLAWYDALARHECAHQSLEELEPVTREMPTWLKPDLKAWITQLQTELSPDIALVAFRTGTFWRPLRLAVVLETPVRREEAMEAWSSLVRHREHGQRLGCEPFLTTRSILEFQGSHLSEFLPLEPFVSARRGVYDPRQVLRILRPDPSLIRKRIRQCVADIREMMLPRLLHGYLVRDPLRKLQEFDVLVNCWGYVRDPAHWERLCVEENGELSRMRARLLDASGIADLADQAGPDAYPRALALAAETVRLSALDSFGGVRL